jgi:hypothetical protein
LSFPSEVSALIGVAVGAALSYTTTYLVERASWLRTQAVRWDERRLAAYADYGYAIKHIVNLASRIASGRGIEKGPEPLELSAENLARLADAEVNRSISAETLRLLCDYETSLASEQMTRCAWTLSWMARGIIECDPETWRNTIIAYARARDEYLVNARQSWQLGGPQRPSLMPTVVFEEIITKGTYHPNNNRAKDAQAKQSE